MPGQPTTLPDPAKEHLPTATTEALGKGPVPPLELINERTGLGASLQPPAVALPAFRLR